MTTAPITPCPFPLLSRMCHGPDLMIGHHSNDSFRLQNMRSTADSQLLSGTWKFTNSWIRAENFLNGQQKVPKHPKHVTKQFYDENQITKRDWTRHQVDIWQANRQQNTHSLAAILYGTAWCGGGGVAQPLITTARNIFRQRRVWNEYHRGATSIY